MKSKWIGHHGQTILFCDYAGFTMDLEALKAEIESVQRIVDQQPPTSVLALIDIRDTVVSIEAARLLRQAATNAQPYFRKTTVVGLSRLLNIGARSIILFSGLQFSIFNDLDSAKDWLVE